MNENLVFDMPFDESNGSVVAYDYAPSRRDGQVTGAAFEAGKIGNAITFAKSGDLCEVEHNVLSLSGPFTIAFYAKASEAITGGPTKMIWVLAFTGVNNYMEVSMDVIPGVWNHLAVVRNGSVFKFYRNQNLINTVVSAAALAGISLNQDYFTNNGFGSVDDLKMYNAALTEEQLGGVLSQNRSLEYYLDGVNFKDFGVFVSDSQGVVGRPKLKAPLTINWDNYHGEMVDLKHKFYEPREITLSCFIKATSKLDFISKISAFSQQFDVNGTHRLMIDIHPTKPLVFEVYNKEDITVSKKWNDDLMVGTFDLKLTEPEPVKRVLRHQRTGAGTAVCTVTLTSVKYVNIYWGDGTVTEDVTGDATIVNHTYTTNGIYYPVITGSIDEITGFSTNAIVVWSKL